MTSPRDPIFWKLNKRIVELVDRALEAMPSYSRNELYFPGVEILNVEIKKLMTQFDYFMFDVTDSLKLRESDTSFQVKIGQQRLNHKPFVMKLNISSLVTGQKGLVKVYLGPKMLPGELAAKKNMFMLLDSFEITMKRGINVVSRSSDEMQSFANDFISLYTLRKRVEDAEFGLDSLPLNTIESQIGFPSRLILPKGTSEGLPLQMFVFIAPFTRSSLGGSLVNTAFNSAILSSGFPLDLKIEDPQLFNLPNVMVKDVTVTHKGDNKNYGKGGEKKWSGGKTFDSSSRPDYGAKRGVYNKFEDELDSNENTDNMYVDNGLLGLRPDFTKRTEKVDNSAKIGQYGKKSDFKYGKREPYDYSAKKEKYEKKDYSSKRGDYKKKINEGNEIISNDKISNTSGENVVKVDLERDVISDSNNMIEKYKIISQEVDDTLDLVNSYGKKMDEILNSEASTNNYEGDVKEDNSPKPVKEPPQKVLNFFDFFLDPMYDSSELKVYE